MVQRMTEEEKEELKRRIRILPDEEITEFYTNITTVYEDLEAASKKYMRQKRISFIVWMIFYLIDILVIFDVVPKYYIVVCVSCLLFNWKNMYYIRELGIKHDEIFEKALKIKKNLERRIEVEEARKKI